MEQRDYLKQHLREVMKVIDSCLENIYAGNIHMYRPLAGQLRILLCDTQRKGDNSLLASTYPDLEVSSLMPTPWSERKSEYIELQKSENDTIRIAQMPFEITVYSNGLVVADLQLASSNLVPIKEWPAQIVTFYPTSLTIFEIIRAVADKGGGAHVDIKASPTLRYISQKTPAGPTYAELFILSLGRFIQKLGERLYGYKGCRVPEGLLKQPVQKINLIIGAHEEWVNALKD